ncbi:MAG: hypothetical protein LBM27_00600 [Lactobacillaceae bacterium]|jgi:hypothetical protein|nr:hypothetical protein [Lactobacillaceae bacterium]
MRNIRDTDSFKMLFSAVIELSKQLGGDSIDNPISPSLRLLVQQIDDYTVKNLLIGAFVEVVYETKLDAVSFTDFQTSIQSFENLSRENMERLSSEGMILYMLNYVAINVNKKAEPYFKKLKKIWEEEK